VRKDKRRKGRGKGINIKCGYRGVRNHEKIRIKKGEGKMRV
jgi:hypothetical protein